MRKILILFALFFVLKVASAQNIGIGTDNPNPSAALDISDSTKGILIPRMTKSKRSAIQNPAEGLMIYQIDDTSGFWFYTGQKWTNINSKGIKGDSGVSVRNTQLSGDSLYITLSNGQTINAGYVRGLTGIQGPRGLTGSGGFNRYIGEYYGGGIVFFIFKDNYGIEHGLIAALEQDISSWSNVINSAAGAYSSWNGSENTATIKSQSLHSSSAAQLCANYRGGGYNDWYLPSINELNALWNNLTTLNKALTVGGGGQAFENYYYWSSTEDYNNSASAWYIDFSNGLTNDYGGRPKSWVAYVRAIRAF